jgi:hypothetical protein
MTFVKGYFRDVPHRPAYIKKTTELLPYDLGDELIGALLRANLAEPLDGPDRLSDFPEDMQRRIREGGP